MWSATTNTWSTLGIGVDNTGTQPPEVYAIAVLNGNVYVGGEFNRAGGLVANNIAEWNPSTSTWSIFGYRRFQWDRTVRLMR